MIEKYNTSQNSYYLFSWRNYLTKIKRNILTSEACVFVESTTRCHYGNRVGTNEYVDYYVAPFWIFWIRVWTYCEVGCKGGSKTRGVFRKKNPKDASIFGCFFSLDFFFFFFFAVLFRVHILLIEDYRDICFTPQGVDLILMITTALK